MATYKVVSDRLSNYKQNEVIDAQAFGDSLSWLLEAGHIVEVSGKAAKTEEVTKD